MSNASIFRGRRGPPQPSIRMPLAVEGHLGLNQAYVATVIAALIWLIGNLLG